MNIKMKKMSLFLWVIDEWWRHSGWTVENDPSTHARCLQGTKCTCASFLGNQTFVTTRNMHGGFFPASPIQRGSCFWLQISGQLIPQLLDRCTQNTIEFKLAQTPFVYSYASSSPEQQQTPVRTQIAPNKRASSVRTFIRSVCCRWFRVCACFSARRPF